MVITSVRQVVKFCRWMSYVNPMKQVIAAAAIALTVTPVTPALAEDDGISLMEEGAKLLFRGLLSEVEPAIDEFSGLASELEPALELFATEFGPALYEMIQTLDSVRYYEAPEILPNGDIIIRRSPDAPEYEPRSENEAIDL